MYNKKDIPIKNYKKNKFDNKLNKLIKSNNFIIYGQ